MQMSPFFFVYSCSYGVLLSCHGDFFFGFHCALQRFMMCAFVDSYCVV